MKDCSPKILPSPLKKFSMYVQLMSSDNAKTPSLSMAWKWQRCLIVWPDYMLYNSYKVLILQAIAHKMRLGYKKTKHMLMFNRLNTMRLSCECLYCIPQQKKFFLPIALSTTYLYIWLWNCSWIISINLWANTIIHTLSDNADLHSPILVNINKLTSSLLSTSFSKWAANSPFSFSLYY